MDLELTRAFGFKIIPDALTKNDSKQRPVGFVYVYAYSSCAASCSSCDLDASAKVTNDYGNNPLIIRTC